MVGHGRTECPARMASVSLQMTACRVTWSRWQLSFFDLKVSSYIAVLPFTAGNHRMACLRDCAAQIGLEARYIDRCSLRSFVGSAEDFSCL